MATVVFPSTQPTPWPALSVERFRTLSAARAKAIVAVSLTLVALGLRMTALSTYGLSEDEVNKVRAIEQYRHGGFSANAEHPMLMKLTMWGSVEAAAAWNQVVPSGVSIPTETAIRFPNAVAGAATTAVLFGLCDVLFGSSVAFMAALLWAFDVNAMAINRIGKEDTFLLFFFVLAMWCYERAKREGEADASRAQQWYTRSGAAFGLMLASKYMPHYLGIYALFNTITDRNPGTNRPARARYYGAMLAAFLVANAAVLLPQTWQYCLSYVQGSTLEHHGYLYAGQLYVTNVPISPLGVPPAYYFHLLGTKVPLAVLGAAFAGVIEMVRRRRERGYVLLRVWLVFVLVPYSLMAAKFIRYALPLLAVIDILAAVGLVAGISWLLRKTWLRRSTRVTVSILATITLAASVIAAQQAAAPFYSLFQNAIGERRASSNAFPEETYDYGVREAVAAIADAAEPSAVIVSDASNVVAQYLKSSGRTDLQSRSLSAQGIPYDGRQVWVIVQDEHMTYENEPVVAQLRRAGNVWREFRAGDTLAAQVFVSRR
jgi:hypothetical protein